MATHTYDPSQVSVIVGGKILMNFEKVTVERNEDTWKFVSGSAGEVTRTKNSNTLGKVTIEVSQGSAEQAFFSGYAGSDALIPIAVQDGNGTSIHGMPEGSCQNVPSAEYAKDDAGTRTWVFEGDLPVHFIGGN